MNPMIVLSSILAVASSQYIASPYAGYAGYGQYAGNYAPYAANYANYAPYAYNQVHAPIAYNQAPVAYTQAPIAYTQAPVVAAPAIPYTHSSQFQAQDEFGNTNYGYSNINSQKHEVGNAYGGVTGGYSYVDPNGELQQVQYIADANGFRVKGTNIPVAPVVPEVELPVAPVYTGVAPEPVQKTAEVLEAEAAFFEKFEEVSKRSKRSVALPYATYPYAGMAGYPYAAQAFGAYPYNFNNYGYNHHGFNYGYAAPLTTTAYAGLAPVEADTPASTTKAEPTYKTVSYAAPGYPAYAGYPYAAAYAPQYAF